MKKITVKDILEKKGRERITALSTYDFPFGKIVDESGIDILLVGDSVGMVVLGYPSTLPVTVRDMLHHAKAVSRAVKNSLFVVDMPFGSFDTEERALRSAKRFVKEAKAEAVKLEGGAGVAAQTKALVRAGIPVMGHLGMMPQSMAQFGGYKVQGRKKKEADKILKDALSLERAGAFSIVLECVPYRLAQKITKRLKIPTIGIGAGPYVDGQVLVLHDILGFSSSVKPRFVRRYENLDSTIRRVVAKFKKDVLNRAYPSINESYE